MTLKGLDGAKLNNILISLNKATTDTLALRDKIRNELAKAMGDKTTCKDVDVTSIVNNIEGLKKFLLPNDDFEALLKKLEEGVKSKAFCVDKEIVRSISQLPPFGNAGRKLLKRK